MFYFKLEKTAIYRAVVLRRVPPFFAAEALKNIFLFLSLLCFSLFVLRDYIVTGYNYLFEWGVVSFLLFLVFFEAKLFFEKHLSVPRLFFSPREALDKGDEINIAEFLDFSSARVVHRTESAGGADSYLLLYFLLKDGNDLDFILGRALIDKKQTLSDLGTIFDQRGRMKSEAFSPCFEATIRTALGVAVQKGHQRVTKGDIFAALCDNNPYMKEVLYRVGLKFEDVIDLTSWQERINKEEDPFAYKNLIKKGSIGKEWTMGYTPFLDDFSLDLTGNLKHSGFPETIGHKKEIGSVERILSRREVNSVVLVGEPGTGRRSIIRELARRSFLGESLPEVNYMRVLQLDISSVLARTDGVEETEMVLDKLFKEALHAGNIILVIDEIHNFVGGEKRPGVVNISGVLEPYLRFPDFRVVGITSFVGFRRQVEDNPSLLSLLEKVEIKEISEKDTLLLLERTTPLLEKRYRKFIPYCTLKKVISLCARHMPNSPFPEKAVDLLEESTVHVDQIKEHILLPEHIEEITSQKVEVPVGGIDAREKEVLLNLEDLIHKRIINQEMAVKEVSSALRRSRAGVSSRKGLIGSFLFLGPTGVGKTETAKAVADIYFNSERRMIRIDMSEFQSVSDISRLIGSSGEEGALTSKVREDPFSLVLLDEIEKAHPDILNIFLQILDEGHVTDGVGRKVDFKNSMVVATSNAGYQIILDSMKSKEDWKQVKDKILNHLFRQSIFRPEFVNRFDAVVLFEPLSKDNLISISGLQLEKISKELKERDMDFVITEDLKNCIVEISYDPLFGAREMQRIIQNKVGNCLSSAILKEEIGKGDRFTIDSKEFTIIKQ